MLSAGLLPWAHTDRTDLTGFPFVWWKISRMLSAGLLQMLTQIQQEDCLWEFVVICGWKIFIKNICVIREIRGSKTSHEFVFLG